jgi:hypothetical protein
MTARTIWEALEAQGWAQIETWVRERAIESVHLEFKPGTGMNAAAIEDALSKAASGFANTEGGVLVFGLDARRGADGIDCVQGLRSAPDARALGETLRRLAREAASPPVVLHVRDVLEGAGPAGAVAVFVPGSDVGPHRAVRGTRKEHYLWRSEAGFSIIPHPILAAMFGRTTPPRLQLRLRRLPAANPDDSQLDVSVANLGRGVARRVLLRLHLSSIGGEQPLKLPNRWHVRAVERWIDQAGHASLYVRALQQDVIYPQDEPMAADIGIPAGTPPLRLHGRLDCDGAPHVPIDVAVPDVGGIVVFPELDAQP